jgi:hypothetical protein
MSIKTLQIILILLTVLTGPVFSQVYTDSVYISENCGEVRDEAGDLRLPYVIYNPFSYGYCQWYSMIFTIDTQECRIILNYSIRDGPQQPPYDTIRLTFDTCSENQSLYECFQYHRDIDFEFIPYYKASLEKMDTMLFVYEGKSYVIEKYKATLPDSQLITIYYSHILGLFKQYASYRSISEDNFELFLNSPGCPRTKLMDAHLEALLLRNDFHERYDEGPRLIRNHILDKKIYKTTRKLYHEKGLMYKGVPLYKWW